MRVAAVTARTLIEWAHAIVYVAELPEKKVFCCKCNDLPFVFLVRAWNIIFVVLDLRRTAEHAHIRALSTSMYPAQPE